MQIQPERDDAPEFVVTVERVVRGLLRRNSPPNLLLFKIDNWFGPKWLSFSGKVLGAISVWKEPVTVPPFVPNRVIYQRRFTGPAYDEVDSGELLHKAIPSAAAVTRKVSEFAPGTALVWYSGNSQDTLRGSIMAYVPEGETYWSWYAGWAKGELWHVVKAVGIRPQDLSALRDQGS